MANISTISYNGSVLAETEEPGNVAVIYDGKTIADIGAGETKTFACADKIMKTNLYIGAKTLLCEMSKMISDVIVAVKSAFPASPSSYTLIGTYTSSQTWTAPESGYFQIEVFGASGKGGTAKAYSSAAAGGGGGGGGGGGYSSSRITMNKGDIIVLTVGGVGATTFAVVDSSHDNSYDHTLQVTSGANGGDSVLSYGEGGAGGTASGGNYSNVNGNAGSNGVKGSSFSGSTGGAGGVGVNGAPNGGNGQSIKGAFGGTNTALGNGSSGFFKIYRGNTN